jgi:hypothetical protein
MYAALGDNRSRREDYRTGQIAMFRKWLRAEGTSEPQIDEALTALAADLKTISGEECPTFGEFADEVARLVGLHERRWPG